jgi:hypothetical protein
MTGEATPEGALEASATYRELFLPAPDADISAPSQAVPDESEAAMQRLRTPFDVGPTDVTATRG